MEGARLMLAGNVVSAAIRQAQLQEQIDITRQIAWWSKQQELKITEQRYRAGGVSEYDRSQPENAVAQTRLCCRRSSSKWTWSTTACCADGEVSGRDAGCGHFIRMACIFRGNCRKRSLGSGAGSGRTFVLRRRCFTRPARTSAWRPRISIRRLCCRGAAAPSERASPAAAVSGTSAER